MTNWDDFLSEETGSELDGRVARSVQNELHLLRVQRRRNLLAWFVPATLGAMGAVVWLRSKSVLQDSPKPGETSVVEEIAYQLPGQTTDQLADQLADIDDETLAIIEDFEMLDNLEVLEKWNS